MKLFWKSKLKQNYIRKCSSNGFSFWYSKSFAKRDVKTITIFCLSKTSQNQHPEFASVFHQNCMKKCIGTTLILMSTEIRSKRVHRNDIDFSLIKIMLKKVRQNNIDFSLIEITSNKVRRNDVYFSPSEIRLKKVLRNDVDFSLIEITSNKARRNNVLCYLVYFYAISFCSSMTFLWQTMRTATLHIVLV